MYTIYLHRNIIKIFVYICLYLSIFVCRILVHLWIEGLCKLVEQGHLLNWTTEHVQPYSFIAVQLHSAQEYKGRTVQLYTCTIMYNRIVVHSTVHKTFMNSLQFADGCVYIYTISKNPHELLKTFNLTHRKGRRREKKLSIKHLKAKHQVFRF